MSITCPGLEHRHIPEDVAAHVDGQPAGAGVLVRGGRAARAAGQLRLPHGVHHAGPPRAARLQPHADRGPAGL